MHPRPPAPRQRTIRETVELAGIGVHTGMAVRVRLAGAAPETGVTFVRRDHPHEPMRASVDAVRDTRRGITLANGTTVATVEHLLSAAAGLGVDNLHVEVEGPELPILDGSAAGYVEALDAAGIVEQDVEARVIELGEAEVSVGRGRAVTARGEGFRVAYRVDLPAPLGEQMTIVVLTAYRTEVAPARTWGFAHEYQDLVAAGLARGAGMENVLVIGSAGYLSPPRFPDEPARHKILDLVGDLALLGARLQGAVHVSYGGHALHVALAREIARRWGGG